MEELLKVCQSQMILKSYDGVYRALKSIEKGNILLNGKILVKNHENYRNIHYLLRPDSVEEVTRTAFQYRDSIEVMHRSRQGNTPTIYIKAVQPLDFEGVDVLEKMEWESYNVIFPWSWDKTGRFLQEVPQDIEESPPPPENLSAEPGFKMTEDMRALLSWYRVNVRLPDVPVMKETGFDHRKVKSLREWILKNSVVHFPVFLYGVHNYTPLYFSFSTKCYAFFMKFFAKNSAVSYLIQGEGRTLLFVNTLRPIWAFRVMEELENTGIVKDMLCYYIQDKWNPLVEDFKSGKIPEKYFWMFGSKRKKEKGRGDG